MQVALSQQTKKNVCIRPWVISEVGGYQIVHLPSPLPLNLLNLDLGSRHPSINLSMSQFLRCEQVCLHLNFNRLYRCSVLFTTTDFFLLISVSEICCLTSQQPILLIQVLLLEFYGLVQILYKVVGVRAYRKYLAIYQPKQKIPVSFSYNFASYPLLWTSHMHIIILIHYYLWFLCLNI